MVRAVEELQSNKGVRLGGAMAHGVLRGGGVNPRGLRQPRGVRGTRRAMHAGGGAG